MWARPASTLGKRNRAEIILYHYEKIWSQRWDSNPRPADYESAALPLSYAGPNCELPYSTGICSRSREFSDRVDLHRESLNNKSTMALLLTDFDGLEIHIFLVRIIHVPSTATQDMAIFPTVLGVSLA